MFKYQFVVDETTGKRYWINRATLINEDGPDLKNGDWYEIDLQPADERDDAIWSIDLIDYGSEVHITKNLNPGKRYEGYGDTERLIAVQADVRDNTLIVLKEQPCRPDLTRWKPQESDRLPIVKELWSHYSTLMSCKNVIPEHEQYLRNILDRVITGPLADCRKDLQKRFMFAWQCWGENVEDAAAGDPERMALYRRVLGLEEVPQ